MPSPFRRYMSRSRFPDRVKRPDGSLGCRGCGSEIPKGRRTWCSQECIDTHEPATVRRAVFERDKGVCVKCGVDAEYIRQAFGRLWARAEDRWNDVCRVSRAAHKSGWPKNTDRSWWEADHIVEFSEGGQTVLSNMQTLCYRCHKAKTRAWHKNRACERKTTLQPQLDL